jgi:hypothetical protein
MMSGVKSAARAILATLAGTLLVALGTLVFLFGGAFLGILGVALSVGLVVFMVAYGIYEELTKER